MQKEKKQLQELFENLNNAQKQLNTGTDGGFAGLKSAVHKQEEGGFLPALLPALSMALPAIMKLVGAARGSGLITGGQMESYMHGMLTGPSAMHKGGEIMQYSDSVVQGGDITQYGEPAVVIAQKASQKSKNTMRTVSNSGPRTVAETKKQQARDEERGELSPPEARATKTASRARAPSRWNEHVSAVRSKHPELSFKEVLIKAKESYQR
jgi:hypothetical protein